MFKIVEVEIEKNGEVHLKKRIHLIISNIWKNQPFITNAENHSQGFPLMRF